MTVLDVAYTFISAFLAEWDRLVDPWDVEADVHTSEGLIRSGRGGPVNGSAVMMASPIYWELRGETMEVAPYAPWDIEIPLTEDPGAVEARGVTAARALFVPFKRQCVGKRSILFAGPRTTPVPVVQDASLSPGSVRIWMRLNCQVR